MKFIVTRNVTPEECSWLKETVFEGTVVDEFDGCTYGCIGKNGVAVNLPGEKRFTELPNSAIREFNN